MDQKQRKKQICNAHPPVGALGSILWIIFLPTHVSPSIRQNVSFLNSWAVCFYGGNVRFVFWVGAFNKLPKIFAVIKLARMAQFVNEYIVDEFVRQLHERNI